MFSLLRRISRFSSWPRRSRFRKSGQQKCQYRGCLIEVVAINIFHAGENVIAWKFDEIEKRGENMEAQEWQA